MVAGKVQCFEMLFDLMKYEVIGLQESRIQESINVARLYYHMISSSATIAGTHGVQIWLHLSLKAKVLKYKPASHRLLIIAVRIKGAEFIFYLHINLI